ncbi:MAG: penicillin-insensitive murein endopeptidase [Pseudomonadota bacterium]
MRRIFLALSLGLAACVPASLPPLSPTMSGQEARVLFGAEATGSDDPAAPLGGYAAGCIAGAEQLAETGPTWQAMRLSRNRNWGHPTLIDFLQDLSRDVAAETSWAGLYIGDMSQPRGGPMLTGHRSHQSGLDADIWMLPARDLSLSVADRENLSSISTRRADGAFVGENWTEEHWDILRLAASDPRVARIFVFPGAKVWMCENETGDRDYLRQLRPWWGHHYHFHVRLNCPPGARGCEEQAPIPAGDGCDEARSWQDRILNPAPPPPPDPNAPPPQPRRELTLADLPRQCASILSFYN